MGENKLNNEKLNDFVRKAIIGGLYWRMKELSKMGKQIFMLYQVIKKSKVVKEADLKPLEARFEKIDVDMDAMGEKVRETMKKKKKDPKDLKDLKKKKKKKDPKDLKKKMKKE